MKVFRVTSLLRASCHCCTYIILTEIMVYLIYWQIGKKNSCPLCQAEGIAEEIRSPDVETTSLSHGDSVNGM